MYIQHLVGYKKPAQAEGGVTIPLYTSKEMAPSQYTYETHTRAGSRSNPFKGESAWIDHTLCDSVMVSKRYTQRLMPGVVLDYIPKHEWDVLNWVGDQHGALKTKGSLLRTKMYVVGDLVGATVDAVVKAAK
ncbi:hypothetical protein FRC10_003504, partial [Ceratobasidium sp. 414]